MAWTTPMTFVAGTSLPAAQLNTYIRDNLNATAVALAANPWGSTPGSIFVGAGVNAIAERAVVTSSVLTQQSSNTAAAYVDLATVGPSVTLTTGTSALVGWSSLLRNATLTANTYVAIAVSGATTVFAADDIALSQQEAGPGTSRSARYGTMLRATNLTAGSNTFTLKYKTDTGTGTWANRRIWAIGL